jgi:polygalacturonase
MSPGYGPNEEDMRPRTLSLALAAALCAAGVTLATAPTASASTGDQRTVTQPSLPSTCKPLTAALAAPSGRTFSSSQETAPPDTSRIQSALNSCAGTGKAVVLEAGGSDTAFLSGPLTIGSGEYLVIDAGVTLFASRDAANYQASSGATCGTVSSSTSSGCNPFITVDGANSGIEGTQSSGHQGTIDGRGDLDVYGTSTTWWDLANTAKSNGGNQVNPRLIQANSADNFTVYDINLVDAAKQHLYYKSGNGLTVWGLRIRTPATARNTDGIDIDSSTNATVNDSWISAGDDCVALETNASASSNTTVENTHCYGTHGISIGSETTYGVSSVQVQNNTVQGTDYNGTASTSANGLRIKSYSKVGGTVSGVVFTSNCLTKEKDLLDFDPFYSSSTGSKYPYFKSVTVNGVTATGSLSGATSVLEGYSASYPLGLTLENVNLDATSSTAKYANVQLYNSDVTPSGTGVTVTKTSGSGSAPSCSFPSFPAL